MSLELRISRFKRLPVNERVDIETEAPARPGMRRVKTALGWTMVVTGPPIGLATPMIPIGFVIFGAGATLVIRNSDRGRKYIRARSRWAERRWPNAYGQMPAKLRKELSGR